MSSDVDYKRMIRPPKKSQPVWFFEAAFETQNIFKFKIKIILQKD